MICAIAECYELICTDLNGPVMAFELEHCCYSLIISLLLCVIYMMATIY